MSLYKNGEGYRDDVAGRAIQNADRMPERVWEVYQALQRVASLHSLEIVGLRDKFSGKEWRR